MRLHDKLLAMAGPRASHGLRRYVARELSRAPATLDSERVAGHLEAASASAVPGEAFQAKLARTTFQPRHIRRIYAQAQEQSVAVSVAASTGAAQDDDVARRCLSSAARTLRPLLDSVQSRLRAADGPAGARLLAVAGSLGVHALPDILTGILSARPQEAWPGLVLARTTPPARAAETIVLLSRLARSNADHLVSLAELGASPGASAALLDFTVRASSDWEVPAAIGVEKLSAEARREVLKRLAALRHGWGLVHALTSLARSGSEEDLPALAELLERFRHPLVRVSVARCLGRLRSPRARELCRLLVKVDPGSAEAAAALESLVRQGVPEAERRETFDVALESANIEVLASAALGTIRGSTQERALVAVRELMGSGPVARAHAAHVLGYLPGQSSAGLLAQLAAKDPDGLVRAQAVAALANHPPSETLAAQLAPLLTQIAPGLRPVAARAMARPAPGTGAIAVEALVKTAKATTGATRSGLIEALGAVGTNEARAQAEVFLKDPSDRNATIGALAAMATSGQRWEELPLKDALASDDPRVAAHACLAAMQDDLAAAAETLERLLTGDDASFEQAVATLETMTLILQHCVTHPRYAHLVRDLTGAGGTSAAAARTAPSSPESPSRASPSSPSIRMETVVPADVSVLAPQEGFWASEPENLSLTMATGPTTVTRPPRELLETDLKTFQLDSPLEAQRPSSLVWGTVAAVALAAACLFLVVMPARRYHQGREALLGAVGGSSLVVEPHAADARADDRPLARGQEIRPPVTLRAGQGDLGVAFAGPLDSMTLAPEARVLVARVDGAAGGGLAVELRDPAGKVQCSVGEKDSLFRIVADGCEILLRQGRYTLDTTAEGTRTLWVDTGEAALTDAGGHKVAAARGDQVVIDQGTITRSGPAPAGPTPSAH